MVHHYQYSSAQLSSSIACSLFLPEKTLTQLVIWLPGIDHAAMSFMQVGGALSWASRLGVGLFACDPEPSHGLDFDGSEGNFASRTSFYWDAEKDPWQQVFKMESFLVKEVPLLLCRLCGLEELPQLGIMGHSMGGHGALYLGVKYPDLFHSVSAVAPITSPTQTTWGIEAYSRLKQEIDPASDACELIRMRGYAKPLLVDQGLDDGLLATQLKPEFLQDACRDMKVDLRINFHEGRGHDYFFVQEVMPSHLRFHLNFG